MAGFKMDILIIGAGLTGAVLARELAENHNKKVVIWERRNHIAGNMYDYKDEHNILVQKYGPHTFHTKEKYLYDYMCKYGQWQPYKLKCMAVIDGRATPTPFNYKTIDDFYTKVDAADLKSRIEKEYNGRKTATVLEVLNSRDEKIREYAEFLYEKDYKLYTAKQWGIPADKIDKSVLERVPLRFSYDEGYFDDEYEVMPKISFTNFFENILNHKNIEVVLNKEALNHIKIQDNNIFIDNKSLNIPVIYTGALDELFNLEYGRLPYRSLRFEFKYEEKDSFQEAPVTAYPQAKDFTRITEYKKLPYQNVKGTTYAVEYPLHYENNKDAEPYYPVITKESKILYAKYEEKAKNIKNLIYAGRLADFKYYNMDMALKRALEVYEKIKENI